MNEYYIISVPISGTLYKKLTYKNYLSDASRNGGTVQYFKVLKSDFNALKKVKNNIKWIFNKLHAERKTAHV